MDDKCLAEIEARAKAGEYGTMCKACSDRLLEVIAEVRRLRADMKGLMDSKHRLELEIADD